MRTLYTDKGFLNVPAIARQADAIDAAFVVIIGARQTGKTYGTLKHMLRLYFEEGRKFILMRRTQAEADFIAHGQISPFAAIDRSVTVRRASQYHSELRRPHCDACQDGDEEVLGIVLALSTVSKIRGFSGAEFENVVFDEFIPEQHVMKIKAEGDAFLNAVVTISGNRELEDRPPLRVWLLANSNNLSSPILEALNLTKKVEAMSRSGQEISVMPDRGVVVVLPRSEEVLQRRKQTAITRAIREDSNFSRMAFGNEFSYNDDAGVTRINLPEWLYIDTVNGLFDLYQHKAEQRLAVTEPTHLDGTYTVNTLKRFEREHPYVRPAFFGGRVLFSSLTAKEQFKRFMKLST